MHNGFYLKMALQNIRKNQRLYLPFIISSIGTIMMTFVIQALSSNAGLTTIPGGNNLQTILGLGYVILILFSGVFLFYMNSFLMKNRKKEFGIYNILGMDKQHITKMLAYEMTSIWFISLSLGVLAGILLNKVAILLVRRMLNAEVAFGFELSAEPIVWTASFFTFIFVAILVANIFQIHLANPIELLRGSNVGEKEPKTKIIWTILGLVLLGIGYYLALTIQSPIMGMSLVFLAILLAIFATYLLFTTGTITWLKLLKRNKNYYYQTKHFIPVSGMLYRMKKNAVGLANISILSVGVILMLSIVAGLYISTNNSVDSQYPSDVVSEVSLEEFNQTSEQTTKEQIASMIEKTEDETGIQSEGRLSYTYLNFPVLRSKEGFEINEEVYAVQSDVQPILLNIIDQANYELITGKKLNLKGNQVAIHGTIDPYKGKELNIQEYTFDVVPTKEAIEEFVIGSETTNQVQESYYIVVSNSTILNQLADAQKEILNDLAANIGIFTELDLPGANAQQEIDFSERLRNNFEENELTIRSMDTRVQANGKFSALRGGVLFLVLTIALLLLMMTVLIIYYKQISEAYDDKERFNIMQKVGLSNQEIRRAIRSQILSVFFLPVCVTGLHVLAVFPLMKKAMVLIMLNQVNLFPISLLIAFVIYLLVYLLVYRLTARTYYKIVQQKN
ncbi:ABC transporter permease [Enterococcus saccharolyticus]|uniref:ABC transporter permease n=1 Tax=Enterococcus saccharolyticus TaxID=41997 RepID=UPI001E2CF848|nr:ABC transporter permease [Enterococcus saccharolyticus]MCD5003090.1 ABC transporter permease [Enterococcus saccharolyticus]